MRAWLAGVSVVVVTMAIGLPAQAAQPAVQRPAAPAPADATPADPVVEAPQPPPEDPVSDPGPAAVEPVTPAATPEAGAIPSAFDEGEPSAPGEPPSAEDPGLPAYDGDIPSYADTPPAPVGPPPRPPDGNGRVAVGSILIGGGVALMGVSGAMILTDTDLAAWIPGALIGIGGLAAGLPTLFGGIARRKAYRSWAEHHGGVDAMPRPGTGMVASGVTCVSAGSFGMLMGAVSLSLQDDDDLPYGEVMLSLGGASVATGVGLLVAGVARRKKYEQWSRSIVTPSFGVLPGHNRRLGGLSFGVSGRF